MLSFFEISNHQFNYNSKVEVSTIKVEAFLKGTASELAGLIYALSL